MTYCCPGGLNAMVVGTSICVGPSSLRQPLRRNHLLHQVRLFPNSKNMSHFSHFLSTFAQTLPLLLNFRPLSIYFLPLRIVDHSHSLIPYIASEIVQLCFLQINAITSFLRGLQFVTDGTGHAEYYSSSLQFSHKAQISSHVAHPHNLVLNFLLKRLAVLTTLAGWGLHRGRPTYCFSREVHSQAAWRVVYHHHRPTSLISRPQQSHSHHYKRILLACGTRYLTVLLNSIASANICG